MSPFSEPFTQTLLQKGLHQGMRVLDIGCGTGEVSALAAYIVGETGSVLGIDSNAQAIETAQNNHPLPHLRFQAADLTQLPDLGQFHAIIGRRILMYLPDVSDILAGLYRQLAPQGVMIFQESDALLMNVAQHLPLHEQVQRWIWQTVQAEQGNIYIGSQLYDLMKKMNMKIVDFLSENRLQTPDTGSDLAWVAQMMQTRMTRHNIVSPETLDPSTLAQRLHSEISTQKRIFIRDVAFGIVARKTT